MSKRGSGSTPSSNKNNKRPRTHHTQSQIDHFFSSPTKKPELHNQFIQGSSRSGPRTTPEVIDVDASEPGYDLPMPVVISESSEIQLAAHSSMDATPPVAFGLQKLYDKNSTSTVGFSPLDVDPAVYEPDSQPSTSDKAPYALLTLAFVASSQTKSRIAILNILTNVLRTIILKYPLSLLPSVYLLSNSLRPQFVAVELGLGPSVISRSIQQISGLSSTALRKLYNTTGDPGDVAFAAKSNLRTLIPHPPLTIPYVYDSLLKIAACKGQGAAKEKQRIVERLLLAASGEEVRYLTRTLLQNLRVGAVRNSILTALARAVVLTPPKGVEYQTIQCNNESFHINRQSLSHMLPSNPKGKKRNAEQDQIIALLQRAESLVKQVYAKHPNFDQIIPALLENGLQSLPERVPLTVGIPVLPMLGSPTRSLDEIYRRLGELPFSAEFKYDGQRAQIHASTSNGRYSVKLFSRHLEDMTTKYPDVTGLVEVMLKDFKIQSLIMDAEIVAIDPASGAVKTFQELSNRARKDVHIKDVNISVCVFAFDLMFFNEVSLLGWTFQDRRSMLRQHFSPMRPLSGSQLAHFDFVRSCESDKGRTRIEEFMAEAVENRCEGLMIKLLDRANDEQDASPKKTRLKSLPSTYEPDLRTSAWLKLKKDYMEGLGDSLDLIPIGAWHGNGRKAQWWSPVLLGLWNPETGRPVGVCKCMSGFSDAFYKSMRQQYDVNGDNCSEQPRWECDFGGYQPGVYFRPHEVWEIRGADVTESPTSIAARGLVSLSRGLSLRFPRFIKTREDKHIEQASTPEFLADMYRSQQKGDLANDEGDLIDVEDLRSSNSDCSEVS